MLYKVITSLVFFILLDKTFSTDSYECGEGWIRYEDEKCFKIIQTFVTSTETEDICRQNGAILGVIRSEEEQQLIKDYIKINKIADNIWIGMRQVNDSFQWTDGTEMKYINFAKGRPLNNPDLSCAMISVDFVRRQETDWENFGKWLDVNCNKKNSVLCEKLQLWPSLKLQEIVMSMRKDLTEKIETGLNELNSNQKSQRKELDSQNEILHALTTTDSEQQEQINTQKEDLQVLKSKTIPEKQHQIDSLNIGLNHLKNNLIPEHQNQINKQNSEIIFLKSNPVPIGFIYVQLSGQTEPNTLWPNTQWQNVSPQYSGQFFRVEGGQSLPFGQVQIPQSPSIEIKSVNMGKTPGQDYVHGPLRVTEQYQTPLFTGDNEGNFYWGIQFKNNLEENRPLNQAIRIWQRIK